MIAQLTERPQRRGVCSLQAQYGDEAVKVQQQQQRRAREAAAAAAGDANLIPLGQRELHKEEKKKEPELDPIPDVEWWDARILLDPKVPGYPPHLANKILRKQHHLLVALLDVVLPI